MLLKIKLLLRVMGARKVWPVMVRIAVVEGGRAGMCGGMRRVRDVAVRRVGNRIERRARMERKEFIVVMVDIVAGNGCL